MRAHDHRAMGRKARGLRAFLKNRKGTAALEFALLAIPFIVLLTAIIETALIFMAQQTLQTATTQAGRLVMTGQVQTQGMTAADFASAVCANSQSLFSCGGIVVNVQTFSSFGAITAPSAPLSNGALSQKQATFAPGNPGDIELVQVYYQWPVVTGLPGLTLATNGNTRLLQATAAFRNEPY